MYFERAMPFRRRKVRAYRPASREPAPRGGREPIKYLFRFEQVERHPQPGTRPHLSRSLSLFLSFFLSAHGWFIYIICAVIHKMPLFHLTHNGIFMYMGNVVRVGPLSK